jgi:hypothetical protein
MLGNTPASVAASLLDAPRAIAVQNRTRCSRRPAGGRPPERVPAAAARSRARFLLGIATPQRRALRQPVEFTWGGFCCMRTRGVSAPLGGLSASAWRDVYRVIAAHQAPDHATIARLHRSGLHLSLSGVPARSRVARALPASPKSDCSSREMFGCVTTCVTQVLYAIVKALQMSQIA